MNDDVKALARIALTSKVLADAAREEGNAAKEALAAHMASGGIERLRVTGDHQSDYGTVVLAAGRKSAQVADEAALLAWVRLRYPDQVVTLVRPAFRDRLLAAAVRAGVAVDTSTGEVVPGIDVSVGDPYLTMRPTPDAKDRMRTLLATHRLLQLDAEPAQSEATAGGAA